MLLCIVIFTFVLRQLYACVYGGGGTQATVSLCGSRTVDYIVYLNTVHSVEIELLSLLSSCRNWSRSSRRRIILTYSSARRWHFGSVCQKHEFR
jgi:hypothetical protein